jgi:hypothetical protein
MYAWSHHFAKKEKGARHGGALALGRQKQEDHEFEASLGCIVSLMPP